MKRFIFIGIVALTLIGGIIFLILAKKSVNQTDNNANGYDQY